MRIAVPIWEDKISPLLDTASKLLILETIGQNKISPVEVDLKGQDIWRRCFQIQKLEVDVLICGGVTRPFFDLLEASGIDLIPGISGDIQDVLEAYLKGMLNQPKFKLPGCRNYQTMENIRSRD